MLDTQYNRHHRDRNDRQSNPGYTLYERPDRHRQENDDDEIAHIYLLKYLNWTGTRLKR